VDDFGSYLFIITHALLPGYNLENLQTIELNCFLGTNFVVTHYQVSIMPPVENVWKRLERDSRIVSNGSDYLCHTILDSVVDEYMPLIDQMDDEIELLEDKVLEKPHPDTLHRILTLKHSVMTLRRIISPQREVMNSLSRDEYPQIDRQSRIYFRDIYDHLVRIQDMSDSIRDIATSAVDVYLNSTSLRLNEVMKALTIVSTIFLPMSFVAGVYGMNFHYMPELSTSWGYPLVWAVFISIPAVMLWYFKRRDWF
jgi:magnesium transporter